ncbi:DNA mismatch repair protein MutT [Paenibacillus sp. CAA11]|uniref:NUDIX hydrolase n=1 Tax=Paenibacillus sp. CAA11 TaxID=1532905 RepID=UPI000D37CDB6|nr:8-oxo-dGTP diphosphatase [Paenibacillus sp. CAA11]AWB44521.1 DNA mismatch repair protein MutT [Paenibacillus sp. CAA11]
MLKYNLCLIRRADEILLLNREKSSWMGCWNGIGGKLEPRESPRDSMVREMSEETGIIECDLHFKGIVTWNDGSGGIGGMYVYVAEVPENFDYAAPIKTREGILDWKKVTWVLDPENLGIAANLPKTLKFLLYDEHCYNHYCIYQGNELIQCTPSLLAPQFEWDQELRNAYFEEFAQGVI